MLIVLCHLDAFVNPQTTVLCIRVFRHLHLHAFVLIPLESHAPVYQLNSPVHCFGVSLLAGCTGHVECGEIGVRLTSCLMQALYGLDLGALFERRNDSSLEFGLIQLVVDVFSERDVFYTTLRGRTWLASVVNPWVMVVPHFVRRVEVVVVRQINVLIGESFVREEVVRGVFLHPRRALEAGGIVYGVDVLLLVAGRLHHRTSFQVHGEQPRLQEGLSLVRNGVVSAFEHTGREAGHVLGDLAEDVPV